MNNVFKKDMYRYYGNGGEPFLKRVFRPLELSTLPHTEKRTAVNLRR